MKIIFLFLKNNKIIYNSIKMIIIVIIKKMASKRQQLDEGYIKKIYQEICEHVEEFKKEVKPDEEAFDNWAKMICQPKFKLIKSLVYLLEQEDTDFQDKEMIFSIFNHILLINPNSANQMIKFESLPKILVDYLFKYRKEKEKNDICAINTLSYTFKIDQYQKLINLELITIILDSLTIVKEQNVLESLIRILIEINSTYKKLDKNIFLEAYHNNENAHLVGEVILRLLNSEKNQAFIEKILYCIKRLMDKENKDIFYSKDLEAFIDIAIRYLESTDNNELRCFVLEVLQRITKFNEFFVIMYKTKDLQDLLDDYIKSDKVNEKVKNISRIILNNFAKNLKRQLLVKSGMKLEDINKLVEEEEDEDEEGEEEEDDEQEVKK